MNHHHADTIAARLLPWLVESGEPRQVRAWPDGLHFDLRCGTRREFAHGRSVAVDLVGEATVARAEAEPGEWVGKGADRG